MSLKTFLMKKMLKSKMKDVPEAEQEKIFGAIEKNPDLFQKIATETQEAMKGGKDQMAAAMEVMQKYQKELQEAMK
ncbi:hypothetical protein H0W32_02070 [Patescibacteria group bacterium]|nr:hypothetical protein [Patescibacteria group bacterium]